MQWYKMLVILCVCLGAFASGAYASASLFPDTGCDFGSFTWGDGYEGVKGKIGAASDGDVFLSQGSASQGGLRTYWFDAFSKRLDRGEITTSENYSSVLSEFQRRYGASLSAKDAKTAHDAVRLYLAGQLGAFDERKYADEFYYWETPRSLIIVKKRTGGAKGAEVQYYILGAPAVELAESRMKAIDQTGVEGDFVKSGSKNIPLQQDAVKSYPPKASEGRQSAEKPKAPAGPLHPYMVSMGLQLEYGLREYGPDWLGGMNMRWFFSNSWGIGFDFFIYDINTYQGEYSWEKTTETSGFFSLDLLYRTPMTSKVFLTGGIGLLIPFSSWSTKWGDEQVASGSVDNGFGFGCVARGGIEYFLSELFFINLDLKYRSWTVSDYESTSTTLSLGVGVNICF
jgi:hypothetical protein